MKAGLQAFYKRMSSFVKAPDWIEALCALSLLLRTGWRHYTTCPGFDEVEVLRILLRRFLMEYPSATSAAPARAPAPIQESAPSHEALPPPPPPPVPATATAASHSDTVPAPTVDWPATPTASARWTQAAKRARLALPHQ